MSVELDAWFLTVVQVYLSSDFNPAPSSKELAVRRGCGAAAPVGSQGLTIMRVNQAGKPLRIALLANVPISRPG